MVNVQSGQSLSRSYDVTWKVLGKWWPFSSQKENAAHLVCLTSSVFAVTPEILLCCTLAADTKMGTKKDKRKQKGKQYFGNSPSGHISHKWVEECRTKRIVTVLPPPNPQEVHHVIAAYWEVGRWQWCAIWAAAKCMGGVATMLAVRGGGRDRGGGEHNGIPI